MNIEIERKFLVKGNFKEIAVKNLKIAQGFLSTVSERTVRIRVADDKGFITVKGISNKSGTTRFEWEKEISVTEAESLLKLCEPSIIEKVRYIIPVNETLFFEVDVFSGENSGLIIAEIELPFEDFKFQKPMWLGDEVTGEVKYYNSMLSKKPYKNW